MAIQKNTADLLAQAAATKPDNTTQDISPQDTREMSENIAVSSYNKITDSALVGLKDYNTLVTYESGQGVISGGNIYISNKITGPGAFVPADWDFYASLSASDQAKLDFISVTAGADLDQMQTDISALDRARVNKGTFAASGGVFPGGGVAQDGWSYYSSDDGTIDGVEIKGNDMLMAIVDNASTSTFVGNWFLEDNSDKVLSVNGKDGVVVVTKTDVGLSNVPNVDATARANHSGTQLAATISDLQATITANTAVAANTSKVTNANHSGDATGSAALTLQPAAITGKVAAAALTGAEKLLLEQSGGLVQSTVQDVVDLAGGDNLGNADLTLTGARLVTMANFGLTFEGGGTIFKGNGSIFLSASLTCKNNTGSDTMRVGDDGTTQFNARGSVFAVDIRAQSNGFSNINKGFRVCGSTPAVCHIQTANTGVGIFSGIQDGCSLTVQGNSGGAVAKILEVKDAGLNNIFRVGNSQKTAIGPTATAKLDLANVTLAAYLNIEKSVAAQASINIGTGVTPTSPQDGDIWFDNVNLFIRIAGVTRTINVT